MLDGTVGGCDWRVVVLDGAVGMMGWWGAGRVVGRIGAGGRVVWTGDAVIGGRGGWGGGG